MSREHIAWVDYAKAISILGIIVGHFSPYFSQVITWAHPLCELMYSFHVAAFFLLSGYTTRQGIMPAGKVVSFAQTCFKPYIVAGVLSAIVCMLFTPCRSFMEWGSALIYASGAYNGELLWEYPFGAVVIGAVWFLPALFVGKLISTSLSKLPIASRLFITAVLFVIGTETAKVLFLPMGLQQALCASWWITCGMILSQTKLLESRDDRSSIVATAIMAAFGLFYMSMLWTETWREAMYCNSTYPNGIIDMLGTTCATIAVILAAKLMVKAPRVVQSCANWIGQRTLPIFCWHAISIAPGVFLSDWLLSFVGEFPATVVFFVALAADIAFAFGMTWVSSKVPGLRGVFFPQKKAKASGLGTEGDGKEKVPEKVQEEPPAVLPNRHPVMQIAPPTPPNPVTSKRASHKPVDVTQTTKKAEDVILETKRTSGHVPSEHETVRRKTDEGYPVTDGENTDGEAAR